MFYRPADSRPGDLAHDPFKAIVAPRPIGWISTVSATGVPNLAPYSFFNAISDSPHMVMFASGGMKDSARNAQETGAFTCNIVSDAMQQAMNASSASVGREVDEFNLAGVDAIAGETVPCPRVAGVPAALECRTVNLFTPDRLDGGKADYVMVVGQVTGIFIDDRFIADGRFDLALVKPIMRAGYRDYMAAGSLFEMERPG